MMGVWPWSLMIGVVMATIFMVFGVFCNIHVYRWLNARMQYLQCVSNGDTVVLHKAITLQWRHNECGGVSNHRRLDCSLNRLFRRRSKKTSKLRVTVLCEGNSPVTRKMFPFDDVIMAMVHTSIHCKPRVAMMPTLSSLMSPLWEINTYELFEVRNVALHAAHLPLIYDAIRSALL